VVVVSQQENAKISQQEDQSWSFFYKKTGEYRNQTDQQDSINLLRKEDELTAMIP